MDKEASFKIIYKFWQLIDEKAHLVDFFEILDENFEIAFRSGDKGFKGYRGLEDHNEIKRQYFDEDHHYESIEVIEQKEDRIVIQTIGIWMAKRRVEPALKSETIKARIRHTWTLRKDKNKPHPILVSQVVEDFEYLEGSTLTHLKK